MTRASVVRGPAARRHNLTSVPGRTGRAVTSRPDPREPVNFFAADGRVALTVHPPKLAHVPGSAQRDMYWRIRPRGWTKLAEKTSSTWTRAQDIATLMLDQLTAAVGQKPQVQVRAAVAEYVSRHTQGAPSARSNRRRTHSHSARQWSRRYRKANGARLTSLTTALGSTTCGALTITMLENFLEQQPSYNAELEMRKTLSAFTDWLEKNSYVLPQQGLHGRLSAYELSKPDTGGRLGGFVDSANEAPGGESDWFVADNEVPDTEAVHAAARALPQASSKPERLWFLELMVLVAAYVGLRLGELLALTCDDVLPSARPACSGEPPHELIITVRRQHIESDGAHIADTKGRRTRRCIVPLTTPAGYELTPELRRRAEQARAERDAGTNPSGLLFPSVNGRSMFWRSNLRSRYWYPALAAARWALASDEQQRRQAMRREQARGELDAVDEPVTSNRYLWTFHSLRHVAARHWVFEVKDIHQQPLPLLAVSQHLGHASTAVTETVYVGGQQRTSEAGR